MASWADNHDVAAIWRKKTWFFRQVSLAKRSGHFLGPALLALCLLFALAPFLYAFGFCFPAGDDFDEATRAMFLFDLPGGLYEIGREWLTWSGRYTYHFLAVFLGKAAESQAASGLVCGFVAIAHGTGAGLIASAAGLGRPKAFFWGCLAITALFAFHQFLPQFYLLTDSLTSGLQGAAFLLFLAFLCRFHKAWRQEDTARAAKEWRLTLAAGVFATGVYEHAALAVFFCAFFCFAAFSLYPRLTSAHASQKGQKLCRDPFARLAFWLAVALAVSFLAPGNFHRAAVRGVDAARRISQLSQAGEEWLAAMTAFIHSPWPLAMLCAGPLVRLWARQTGQRRSLAACFSRCAAYICLFCLFSLGIAIMHALSDAPLGSAPKLAASLGLYAAITLGFALYELCGPLARLSPFQKAMAANMLVAAFFILVCQSGNFQKTALNAANGTLLLYGQFRGERDIYLKQLAERGAVADSSPGFGLIAEIRDKNARKAVLDPRLPATVVARQTQPVFPVSQGEPLGADPEGWPNIWASRLYGLGACIPVQPDGKTAVEIVRQGNGMELRPPAALRAAGISKAWKVAVSGEPNRTFAENWLVLLAERPLEGNIRILRPNPLSWKRLAPLALQKSCLTALLESEKAALTPMNLIAASNLGFAAPKWRLGRYYALPLGDTGPAPAVIFAGIDNMPCFRLSPYL